MDFGHLSLTPNIDLTTLMLGAHTRSTTLQLLVRLHHYFSGTTPLGAITSGGTTTGAISSGGTLTTSAGAETFG